METSTRMVAGNTMTTQIQTAMDMYWATNVLSADPPIVWDTFKAVSRGECISAIKAARRDHNAECEILLAKERECAKLQADSPSESNYASLFSDIGDRWNCISLNWPILK